MYVRFTDIKRIEAIGHDEVSLGHLDDLYIDTRDWRTAYVVIDAGGWLASQRVLIDPGQAGRLDPGTRTLQSSLGRYDIETAPPQATVRTVGNQEGGGRLPFGAGPFLAGIRGAAMPPGLAQPLGVAASDEAMPVSEEERHLRSAREIIGYGVHGSDHDVGSIDDVLIDPDDWSVAFLAIDTGHWLPGKRVVIAPNWASSVSFGNRRIDVALSRERIENSPPLNDLDGLDRRFAKRLSDFYRL